MYKKIDMILIKYLLSFFKFKKKIQTSRLYVQKDGSILETPRAYTKRQLKKIFKMEHRMFQKGEGYENELVHFEDFFVNVLPEASTLNFGEMSFLWKHYHYILFGILTGNKKELRFENFGVFCAVIEVALIIRFSEEYVTINLPQHANEIISMSICKESIKLARCKGIEVTIINRTIPSSTFSVRSGGMAHHQITTSPYYFSKSWFH